MLCSPSLAGCALLRGEVKGHFFVGCQVGGPLKGALEKTPSYGLHMIPARPSLEV